MNDFIQLLLSGLASGSIYALAALGFTLLWQASGTINFAQGEFVMLPAFMMLGFMAIGASMDVFRGQLGMGLEKVRHGPACTHELEPF